MSHSSADLVFLHPTESGSIAVDKVRELARESASVVVVWTPPWNQGFSRADFVGFQYQCGVDLEQLPGLRLRDIVLVRQPVSSAGSSKLMLLVYNSDDSHYDIDAVRVPWERVSGPRDKRNNPLGKNLHFHLQDHHKTHYHILLLKNHFGPAIYYRSCQLYP